MGIACLRPSARRPSTFQLTTQNEPGGFAVLGIGSRSVTGSALALATFPRGALTFSATASSSSATAAVSIVLRFVPAAACSSSAGAAFAACFLFGAIVRGLLVPGVLTWSGSVLWVRELRLAALLRPRSILAAQIFSSPKHDQGSRAAKASYDQSRCPSPAAYRSSRIISEVIQHSFRTDRLSRDYAWVCGCRTARAAAAAQAATATPAASLQPRPVRSLSITLQQVLAE
jgi:hypothetical protein